MALSSREPLSCCGNDNRRPMDAAQKGIADGLHAFPRTQRLAGTRAHLHRRRSRSARTRSALHAARAGRDAARGVDRKRAARRTAVEPRIARVRRPRARARRESRFLRGSGLFAARSGRAEHRRARRGQHASARSDRHAGAEGAVAAAARRRRDPLVLLHDRAASRRRRRPEHAANHRQPRRRRLRDQRQQVVHHGRGRRGGRDHHGEARGRPGHHVPRRHEKPGHRDRAADGFARYLLSGRPCRRAVRGLAGAVGERARRGGRGLSIRPGAPLARAPDALHALAGRGAAGA